MSSSSCQKKHVLDVHVSCVDSAPSKSMASGASTVGATSWDAPTLGGQCHRRRAACSVPLCVLAGCCVVFFVVCVALSTYIVSYMHQMERRMEERVDRAVLKCSALGARDGLVNAGRPKTKHSGLTTFDFQPLRFKRSKTTKVKPKKPNNDENKPKCKKPKPNLRCPASPPNFFHLVGRNNSLQYHEGKIFIWSNASIEITDSMELVKEPLTGGIIKIRVRTKGTYLVYSQVAVTGQDKAIGNVRHECSHETVKSSQPDKPLLSSLVTQHNLGENDSNKLFTRGFHPVDTKLQMGVFVLEKGDDLSVRIQKGCNHFNYSVSPDNSYFGVVAMNI